MITGIQYFVTQWVVARRFVPGYRLADNTISDLGNTVCGLYGGRDICSPRHVAMNFSFVALGIGMTIGALLLLRLMPCRTAAFGLAAFAVGGGGVVLVGLFPENTVATAHVIGAGASFLVANFGILLLGLTMSSPRWHRGYTVATGLLTLCALLAFVSGNYFWLGLGGMERLVGYPQTLWQIILGASLLFSNGAPTCRQSHAAALS